MKSFDHEQLESALHAVARMETARPPSCPDLAAKVRGRCRRRKRNRIFAATAATAMLLLSAFWIAFGSNPRMQPGNPDRQDIAAADQSKPGETDRQVSRKIERMEEELDLLRNKLADIEERLAEAKRPSAATAEAGEPLLSADDLDHIENEKTAYLVLYRAERYLEQTDKTEALKEYRRILEHFPRTTSAGKAKEQIDLLTAN